MDASAGPGQTGDEWRQPSYRPDRRLRQSVDLPGRRPRYAAGKEEGEVGGGVVRLWAGVAVRGSCDDRH